MQNIHGGLLCVRAVGFFLFYLMFYSGTFKYQKVDGQLQRYHIARNQRQILDQQAVAQESDFRGEKNTCACTVSNTPGNCVYERKGLKRQLSSVPVYVLDLTQR